MGGWVGRWVGGWVGGWVAHYAVYITMSNLIILSMRTTEEQVYDNTLETGDSNPSSNLTECWFVVQT